MKVILACFLAVLVLTGPARADDQSDVATVIQNQLDAFRADDFAKAFTYASPGIKRMFGNPDRFGLMVREGYPMVWRPADVQFLGFRSENGLTAQQVLITDADGISHVLEYQMVETENGWQIAGVRILQAPGVGA